MSGISVSVARDHGKPVENTFIESVNGRYATLLERASVCLVGRGSTDYRNVAGRLWSAKASWLLGHLTTEEFVQQRPISMRVEEAVCSS